MFNDDISVEIKNKDCILYNDKERDMNPPEPREEYEPDWDSINDDKWLRKKEEEENELRETNAKTKCA